MTTQVLRAKVEARLLKTLNPAYVKELMDLHFDYASKTYSTVKQIAECIVTIY